MGDPASISFGVIALAQTGLHVVRLLLRDIDAIKNAPSAILDVKLEVNAVEKALAALETLLGNDNTPSAVRTAVSELELKPTITACETASAAFRATLKKWLKHSDDTHTFWWDRVRVGLFGESKIESFKRQLNSSKLTINLALTVATLGTASKQLHVSEEQALQNERRLVQIQQQEAEQQLVLASRRAESNESPQEVLSEDGESSAAQTELHADIQRELLLLCNLTQAQRTAIAQFDTKLSKVHITGVRVSKDSKASVGLINQEEGQHAMDIRDVTVEENSRAIIGKAKVDLTGFWD